MKYELLYKTEAEYTEIEGVSDVTSATPGVAYIEENDGSKFNKDWVKISLIYEVSDISAPTRMYTYYHHKTNLKRVVIDGKTIALSDYTETYQFSSTGRHYVHLFYSEKDAVYAYNNGEYTNCTDLI